MAMSKKTFYDLLATKKIAFIGLGVSHNDLIRKYAKQGSNITVLDKSSKDDLGDIYDELTDLGISFILGKDYLSDLTSFDIVFRSPGVRFTIEEIADAVKQGVVITSEMEMFFELCPCKIYAVTGSDGKTTTTTIISKLLEKQGKRVFLGGNIGRALLPLIDKIDENDVAVVELSSFQLISMRQSPDVAVITNISPNHLDAHKDMDEYVGAKLNIITHQSGFSKTVLNLDNGITASLFEQLRGEGFGFSRKKIVQKGTFLDSDGNLCFADKGKVVTLFNKDDIKIIGVHNVENFLAAACATYGDVSPENMKQVALTFGGVEHRNEFVRELNGIKWYNDSIATSPTRTNAGLDTFDKKIILIAGGYDKHIPYAPLAPKILQKVKVLILMGDTAEKIEKAVVTHLSYKKDNPLILHAESMEEAVYLAKENAKSGDYISLSPASASFGMYKNFELRGEHYKNIVNNLE